MAGFGEYFKRIQGAALMSSPVIDDEPDNAQPMPIQSMGGGFNPPRTPMARQIAFDSPAAVGERVSQWDSVTGGAQPSIFSMPQKASPAPMPKSSSSQYDQYIGSAGTSATDRDQAYFDRNGEAPVVSANGRSNAPIYANGATMLQDAKAQRAKDQASRVADDVAWSAQDAAATTERAQGRTQGFTTDIDDTRAKREQRLSMAGIDLQSDANLQKYRQGEAGRIDEQKSKAGLWDAARRDEVNGSPSEKLAALESMVAMGDTEARTRLKQMRLDPYEMAAANQEIQKSNAAIAGASTLDAATIEREGRVQDMRIKDSDLVLRINADRRAQGLQPMTEEQARQQIEATKINTNKAKIETEKAGVETDKERVETDKARAETRRAESEADDAMTKIGMDREVFEYGKIKDKLAQSNRLEDKRWQLSQAMEADMDKLYNTLAAQGHAQVDQSKGGLFGNGRLVSTIQQETNDKITLGMAKLRATYQELAKKQGIEGSIVAPDKYIPFKPGRITTGDDLKAAGAGIMGIAQPIIGVATPAGRMGAAFGAGLGVAPGAKPAGLP